MTRQPKAMADQSTEARLREALNWFSGQRNLELHYESPVYGDDDGPEEWQVHRVNGGINDREWTLIGKGATAHAAIIDAASAAISLPVQDTSDELTRLHAEVEARDEALRGLEKAATEVARYGAVTGSQWSRLSTQLILARAALQPKEPENG